MSLADIFKKIFGSKADRDMKAIRPTLEKVLLAYESIDKLSDDQLREKCQTLKDKIKAAIAEDEARIAEIKEQLEGDIPLSQKEKLATESDKLVKKVDETIESILDEILPEAFAIMKSTARRFKENAVIASVAPEQMGTCVINDPAADEILLCGTIYRAAAKFIINIKQGANVEFQKELKGADDLYRKPQYYINQLPVSTRVLPQQATDYYIATTQNTATTGLNPYTFEWIDAKTAGASGDDGNKMTITGYGYSDDWSKLEYTKQTSMLFNLPMTWDKDKNAENGKEASTADNWYSIPLSKEKRFERNTCYIINVTVNAVGAEEKEYAIELKDIEYTTQPWEKVTVDIGGYDAAYLTLNTDLVKIYDTNIDKDQLTFASSSPIKSIRLADVYKHNADGTFQVVEKSATGAGDNYQETYAEGDGVWAYYIDKFGQSNQLGSDPGFDIKDVDHPEWTKEEILAKEKNLYAKEGAEKQYIRAEIWEGQEYALNGNITIHSPINAVADNDDLDWNSHFNTVRYLEFVVENEQGITTTFRVEQIPLVYITQEEGFFSYRDDFTRKDGEGPAYWTNYMGPGSITTVGLHLVHEHDWTEEAKRPQSWWDTRQSDRDYGWLDDGDYPHLPNNNAEPDVGKEGEQWEEMRYGFVANIETFISHEQATNGMELTRTYSGGYRPYGPNGEAEGPGTKYFVRHRFWNLPGATSSKNESQGLAVGSPYEKEVMINGVLTKRTFRKHYSWNIQPFFYSKYVSKVYKEDGYNENGQRRLKGQADIINIIDGSVEGDYIATDFMAYSQQRLNRNHRMYKINTTSTSSKYTLGYPTLEDADGNPTNDTERGVVANNQINARMVSPTLMLASQLGQSDYNTIVAAAQGEGYILPVLSDFYIIAKNHCREYVETTFEDLDGDGEWDKDSERLIHYNDWRLPTKAEIEMIIEHQNSSRAMDFVLLGEHFVCITGNPGQGDDEKYWVSDEVPGYKVSAEQDLDGIAYNNFGYYIRCVRDVR